MSRSLGVFMLAALLVAATAATASARAGVDDEGIRQPRSGGGGDEYRGRKVVGGRTEVRDVEGDGEVQELGRFCVAEYNRQQLRERGGDGGERLEFGRVVAAQRQVVSGLKYYLRVAAVAAVEGGAGGNAAGGEERVFDAVVVVKPWLESRTLLKFAPAEAR